jgi:antirestriction protein ArdC/DNA repair protein RadC
MNRDLYQVVTDKIVAALETGTPPWIRPWSGDLERVPVNGSSRRPYRGINCILLTLEAQLRGFARNLWLTYRQAAALGAQVRGGERGVTVVFYKPHELPASEAEDRPEPRVVPLLRSFTVFNVEQVDRLPERLQQPAAEPNGWLPEHAPEELLANSGARIEHGGFAAFYSPADDRIQLPERELFADAGSYYATALHEVVHWSGHPKRLDRQLGRRFGEAAYAVEELIAEIGSAFLCAACRLEGHLQHPAYIANWVKVLKADKRAVFTAAQGAAGRRLRRRPGQARSAGAGRSHRGRLRPTDRTDKRFCRFCRSTSGALRARTQYEMEHVMNDDKIIERALKILAERVREGAALTSPGAVHDYLRLALSGLEHEVFVCIWVDAQHRVIDIEEAFRGTLTQTSVYPREIVKSALRHNAAAVIFAHNHPSGVAQPSQSDELLTRNLKEALALIECKTLDHFVVAGVQAISFAERGLL